MSIETVIRISSIEHVISQLAITACQSRDKNVVRNLLSDIARLAIKLEEIKLQYKRED